MLDFLMLAVGVALIIFGVNKHVNKQKKKKEEMEREAERQRNQAEYERKRVAEQQRWNSLTDEEKATEKAAAETKKIAKLKECEPYIQTLKELLREERRVANAYPDDGHRRAAAARRKLDYMSQLRMMDVDYGLIESEAHKNLY